MSGNTFGRLLRLTTFGESHGTAIGGVIDGIPPRIPLNEADIQPFLDERVGGGKGVTPRKEADKVQLFSGLFEGQTTGTPIGFVIHNENQRSKDYDNLADLCRPGHADWSYQQKYGIRDHRGGGRASARETASRVVGGAVARRFLEVRFGLQIGALLESVGEMDFHTSLALAKAHRKDDLFCEKPLELLHYLDTIRGERESVGGRVVCLTSPLPPGLGEPVFDRLDALLAFALMSIPAAKAVAMGEGWEAHRKKGSTFRDPLCQNGDGGHAGGSLGGISYGEPLKVAVNFKPTSSIPQPITGLDSEGLPKEVLVQGRHDPCVAVRAVPIVEAMVALVLADLSLIQAAKGAGTP